jgi:PGF-CTERM protein/uncharacterized repeat protein (TIGR01451 family)
MSKRNNRKSLMDCLMNRRVVVSVLVAVFVLGGLASPAIAQASTDAVLILHLDEGSGNILHDYSGNGNDGVIYGASWVEGKYGKALSFDGRDDYVNIQASGLINGEREVTYSAWIYINVGSQNYPGIIYHTFGSNKGNGLNINPDNTATARYTFSKDEGVSSSTLQIGQWHHIVSTYKSGIAKIYVNGILDNTRSITNGAILDSGNWGIGYDNSFSNSRYFNGIIDEVRIYNRALTEEEIKVHYEEKQIELTLTKSASPYSIKQEQKTTVKITVENTGTTTIKDIEVVDTPSADFDFVSGEASGKYGSLKSGESRTLEYTIESKNTGKFDLGQATATYADEEGNYQTVKSNSLMVEVLSPLEKPEMPGGEEGEEKGMPGFEVAFAIAGLLAVVYLLRRRE